MKRFMTLAVLMICLHGFAQQKIYVCSNDMLYTVNINTCTSQFIGFTGTVLWDIAVTPDGRLWGILQDNLYSLDTLTGASTFIGVIGYVGNALVELDDSTLIMAGGSNLYRINLATGLGSLIGATGYNSSGDLTWYDNGLYLTESSGLLIKIQLNNTNTSILSSTPVTTNFIPPCPGTITSPFTNQPNSIVGFLGTTIAGTNVYKICPLDASNALLCSAIIPFNATGAAAHRLSIQKPPPVSCDSLTAVNELHTEGFEPYPNPATDQFTIYDLRFAICEIAIYNTLGERVFSQQLKGNNQQQIVIDVSTLVAGFYFLKLNNVVRKFVKE